MTYKSNKSKNAQRQRSVMKQVRFSPEENAALEKLRQEWGASSVAEVIRTSVRNSLLSQKQ